MVTIEKEVEVEKPDQCPRCGHEKLDTELSHFDTGTKTSWVCMNLDCCETIRPEEVHNSKNGDA